MQEPDRIVAVGLLTERDLASLGEGFKRQYPLGGPGIFGSLLAEIDKADREYRLNSFTEVSYDVPRASSATEE